MIELMVTVALIGLLAALAVYGIAHYFASAKVAEAKNIVGGISQMAAAAFEREKAAAELLSPGGVGSKSTNLLCDTATHKIPSVIPSGNKVNPDPSEQVEPDPRKGWTCLRFSLTEPVVFQYNYERNAATATAGLPDAPAYPSGADFFEASAKGDLDADGAAFSTFARGGAVQPDGSLTLATTVYSDSPNE